MDIKDVRYGLETDFYCDLIGSVFLLLVPLLLVGLFLWANQDDIGFIILLSVGMYSPLAAFGIVLAVSAYEINKELRQLKAVNPRR